MAPEIIAAIVGAGATAAASIGSGIQAGKLNRVNRKWQEKMYDKQLADSIKIQDKQNAYNKQLMEEEFLRNAEYNSPVAQIARYQEAGLNPNLAYGSVGGETSLQFQPSAGADVPSAGASPYQASMQFDFSPLMSAMNAFVDIKAKKDLTDAQVRKINTENYILEKSIPYQFGGTFYEYDYDNHEFKRDENGNLIPHESIGTFGYQLSMMERNYAKSIYDNLSAKYDYLIKQTESLIRDNQYHMSEHEKSLSYDRLENAKYMKSKIDSIFNSNDSTGDKMLNLFQLFIFNTLNNPNFNAFNVR